MLTLLFSWTTTLAFLSVFVVSIGADSRPAPPAPFELGAVGRNKLTSLLGAYDGLIASICNHGYAELCANYILALHEANVDSFVMFALDQSVEDAVRQHLPYDLWKSTVESRWISVQSAQNGGTDELKEVRYTNLPAWNRLVHKKLELASFLLPLVKKDLVMSDVDIAYLQDPLLHLRGLAAASNASIVLWHDFVRGQDAGRKGGNVKNASDIDNIDGGVTYFARDLATFAWRDQVQKCEGKGGREAKCMALAADLLARKGVLRYAVCESEEVWPGPFLRHRCRDGEILPEYMDNSVVGLHANFAVGVSAKIKMLRQCGAFLVGEAYCQLESSSSTVSGWKTSLKSLKEGPLRNETGRSSPKLSSKLGTSITRKEVNISDTGAWAPTNATAYYLDEGLALGLCVLLGESSAYNFGAGKGHYELFMASLGCGSQIRSYDGAANIAELTGGRVQTKDLTVPFDLGQPMRWSLSFEVAEHIPPQYSDIFVDNLIKHSSNGLIISWAHPGQTGHGHVNLKSSVQVIDEMKERGFVFCPRATEFLRAACVLKQFQMNTHVFYRAL